MTTEQSQEISKLTANQMIIFYRLMLQRLEISRHSDPTMQLQFIISANTETIQKCIDLARMSPS